MGRFVIAGYRPKPGMAAALELLALRHWEVLHREALVTDRPAHLMRASDGTVVEVFEWLSTHSIARAHNSAAVQALWAEFAAVCEHVPLSQLPGADVPFAEFDALPPG
ncbi:MAG: hypothetical protein LCI02_17095 [Proteobacteria bacterium]|nr:hypothetical protein [Pseudomonadota bacterium]